MPKTTLLSELSILYEWITHRKFLFQIKNKEGKIFKPDRQPRNQVSYTWDYGLTHQALEEKLFEIMTKIFLAKILNEQV